MIFKLKNGEILVIWEMANPNPLIIRIVHPAELKVYVRSAFAIMVMK